MSMPCFFLQPFFNELPDLVAVVAILCRGSFYCVRLHETFLPKHPVSLHQPIQDCGLILRLEEFILQGLVLLVVLEMPIEGDNDS